MLCDIPFIFCYIDDILVSSPTIEDHEHHLRKVFTCLLENHLTVNLDKCVLAQPTVTFLGHKGDSEGICPLPKKGSAIQQFPPPMSKLDVQRLLGMTNFYRQFLPRHAHIVCPLTDSLAFSKKEFTITTEMLHAVNEVKHAISNATLLVHSICDTVLSITMDASDTAITGTLHQHH